MKLNKGYLYIEFLIVLVVSLILFDGFGRLFFLYSQSAQKSHQTIKTASSALKIYSTLKNDFKEVSFIFDKKKDSFSIAPIVVNTFYLEKNYNWGDKLFIATDKLHSNDIVGLFYNGVNIPIKIINEEGYGVYNVNLPEDYPKDVSTIPAGSVVTHLASVKYEVKSRGNKCSIYRKIFNRAAQEIACDLEQVNITHNSDNVHMNLVMQPSSKLYEYDIKLSI